MVIAVRALIALGALAVAALHAQVSGEASIKFTRQQQVVELLRSGWS